MVDVKKTYDETPYKSMAFPNSCITHIDAIATFLGLKHTSSKCARVLEIGCSFGGNILMSAVCNPKSEFIGIDLSETQITQGKEIIKSMKLKNIKLIRADICDETQNLGEFDYIICHGVYSWVPDNVKKAILGGGRTLLAQDGIMYVSYNTYPGWKNKEILRDIMCYVSKDEPDNMKKLAKSKEYIHIYNDYISKMKPEDLRKQSFSSILTLNSDNILNKHDDYYILHEYLEIFNDPCYFYEFLDRARENDLEYIIDAGISTSFISLNDLPIEKKPTDRIQKEQMGDFLANRTFRSSLLAKKENVNNINEALNGTFQKENINKLHFFGSFTIEGGNIKTNSLNDATYGIGYSWIAKEFNDVYPKTLNVADLIEKFPDKINEIYDALVKFICYGSITLSISKLDIYNYVPHKTRLKQSYRNYLEYFSKNETTNIAISNILNNTISKSAQDIKFMLMFDGNNSIDDIILAVKKYLKTSKINLTRTKPDGTSYAITQENEIATCLKEYVTQLESTLKNFYFFEEI